MTTELKPCPICHGEPFVLPSGRITCRKPCKLMNRTIANAEDWNNRPAENKLKADAVQAFVDEIMIAYEVYFEGLPKEQIGKFIDYVSEMQLDPSISEKAARLKAEGIREAAYHVVSADVGYGVKHKSNRDALIEYANKLEKGEL